MKRAVDYASQHNSRSVRIYRHNCLVATSALDPLIENVAFDVWSTTKGVTSMLAGRAEQLGYLDLDDPIGPYLAGDYAIDAEHGAITIRELLTQSSGLHLAWPPELPAIPTTRCSTRSISRSTIRAAPTSNTARRRSRCSRA